VFSWEVKPSPSLPVLQQPRGRAAEPFDGQKAAVGLAWAFGARRAARRPVCLKKPLHRGVARWLSAGQPFECFGWLGCYARDLLALARCADLPPVAREASQHWPRRRSFSTGTCCWPAVVRVVAPRHAVLPADDAVASHRAACGRDPSIEATRTHAHGISRGAVAVLRAFHDSHLDRPRPLLQRSFCIV
jgi:hypothetical protein